MRQVLLYPVEDGYWFADCPSLPGCISRGRTRSEALARIQKNMIMYIADLIAEGKSIPHPKTRSYGLSSDTEAHFVPV